MIYLWCHELEGANHGALHLVHPAKFSRKSEVNQPEVQHTIRIITWAIFQNNFNFKLKFLKAYFWWLRSFYLTLRLRGSLELKRTLFGLMSRWQTRALCRYSRASASWRKELVGFLHAWGFHIMWPQFLRTWKMTYILITCAMITRHFASVSS